MLQDEFAGDGVDLYDDVIAAPAGGNGGVSSGNTGDGGGDTTSTNEETNGNAPYHQLGNNIQPNQIGRRHQLYIGNLTWVYNNIYFIFYLFFFYKFKIYFALKYILIKLDYEIIDQTIIFTVDK